MRLLSTGSTLTLTCGLLLTACSGSGGDGGNHAPTASFGGPGASLPASSMSLSGATIQFNIVANDPDDVASLAIFADIDGDLATLADQVSIVSGLEDKDGDLQTVPWDTTGVPAGDYKLVASLSDGENPDVTVRSDGILTITEVVKVTPTGILLSSAETLRIEFDHALANATPSATSIPVLFNSLPIEGSYALSSDGLAVLFTPTSGSFDAPGLVRFEVHSDLLFESAATPVVAFAGAFNTRASRVFVASADSPVISVMNSQSMAEITQIPVEEGTELRQGIATREGLLFFSALKNNVSPAVGLIVPVDGATASVLNTIELAPLTGSVFTPTGLAFSPDEKFLYVTAFEGEGSLDTNSTPYIVIIETSTRTELARIELATQGRVTNLVISPDGRRAFASNIDSDCVHVVQLVGRSEVDIDDIPSNGVTPLRTTPSAPFDLTLNPGGDKLYVSFDASYPNAATGATGTANISTYDTTSYVELNPLMSSALAENGSDLTFNSRDGLLYALRNSFSNGEGLSVIDPETENETIVPYPGVVTPPLGYVGSSAFIEGTSKTLVSAPQGSILTVRSEALAADPTSASTTLSSIASLTTIPAARELPIPVEAPNQAPVSFAGMAAWFEPGNLVIDFDASHSFDPDANDAIENYSWDFGDGQSETSRGPTTSHEYLSIGDYLVTLTVSDGELVASSTTNVFASEPPTCVPGPNVIAAVNSSIALDASASSAATGFIATFEWTFPDGQTANGIAPAVTLGTPVSGLGVLTVTDSAGSSSSCSFSVHVHNTKPTCSIISTPGGTTTDSLVFDGSLSSSNDIGDTIVAYEWDFESDGTLDATGDQVFHTFPVAGLYSVMLTVTDSFGAQSSCATVIEII